MHRLPNRYRVSQWNPSTYLLDCRLFCGFRDYGEANRLRRSPIVVSKASPSLWMVDVLGTVHNAQVLSVNLLAQQAR